MSDRTELSAEHHFARTTPPRAVSYSSKTQVSDISLFNIFVGIYRFIVEKNYNFNS